MEIAKKAAQVRWASRLPTATHGADDHPLRIGDIEIPCYVLEDGRRVIVQSGVIRALGMTKGGSSHRGGTRLAKFASGKGIKPFATNELIERTESPIKFKTPSGMLAFGFEATVLADLCEAVLSARDARVLQRQQEHIAAQCEILVRGFARVGIVALVDEATGYQYDRSRRALEEILDAFIKDELGKWMKRFPDEFYFHLFRLKDLQYIPFPSKKPRYVGHWTNDIVYSRLAPGIKKELAELTPKTTRGNRRNKFHQWLTDDIGHPKLQEHLASVIALMKASDSWAQFHKMLDRSLPSFQEIESRPLFKNLEYESD